MNTTSRALVLLGLLVSSMASYADEPQKYEHGPDSQVQKNVPEGKISKHTWKSKIFEGTIREYFVYVPAKYNKDVPTAIMVFQDGHAYVNKTGEYRVPVVFDNLMHKGELPQIIGIFINPGEKGEELPKMPWKANNRSVEYDTVSDTYVRFLETEMIPEVAKELNLSKDPNQRAICGGSSGGICAFTAAWERPDLFRKVLSHIGSFTNIRGGYVYQALIRKTEHKPLRVYLQDGDHDVDNQFGSWWLSNQEMAASLKFAGYDYQFVTGHGAHNGNHGGAVLPDAMRWLWRPDLAGTKTSSMDKSKRRPSL